MDQGTAESELFEFLVCQQAQISVSEASKSPSLKTKSPVTVMFLTFAVEQNHVENFYKSQAN